MGKNFERTTKGKVGDIIYPTYNGTNGFLERPRWDLVTEVDEQGNILNKKFIWDVATVNAIKLMLDVFDIKVKETKTNSILPNDNDPKKIQDSLGKLARGEFIIKN